MAAAIITGNSSPHPATASVAVDFAIANFRVYEERFERFN
jgi:hypothetical protein